MTNQSDFASLEAHLEDLQEKSLMWHKTVCSNFLSEEEQAYMQKVFIPSKHVVYDGGYPNARTQKVIFRYDAEDDFSDIVCLKADIDQRFKKITHRDILGALMHLQIERSSFGDFWIENDHIYLYTSESMAQFLIDHLIKINQLNVSFYQTDEWPEQTFQTKRLEMIVNSERIDAIVACLANCSRSVAKEMIRHGLVQVDHVILEDSSDLCHNNAVISIRKVGRFLYVGPLRNTRNGRLVVEIQQYV